jgi:nucleotide-binding universal stress UspA family protein
MHPGARALTDDEVKGQLPRGSTPHVIGGQSMDICQILAPSDFSEPSKQAVTCAYEWARTFGAKLLLLHVVQPVVYPVEIFQVSGAGTTLLDDLEHQARLDLAQLLPKSEDGTVEVRCQAVVGTPYLRIIELAAADHVDLIVMSTHGRTGLSHLVMGSVAERVVRTAPCPVLTIRPTDGTT